MIESSSVGESHPHALPEVDIIFLLTGPLDQPTQYLLGATLLATKETFQKFQRVEYMISLSGTGICGEENFRWR